MSKLLIKIRHSKSKEIFLEKLLFYELENKLQKYIKLIFGRR